MPSRRSSDSTARRQAWSSTSMAASTGRSPPTSRAHLAIRTAVGALPAISAARAVAVASTSARGTTRSARPSCLASSAPTRRPVSTRSLAAERPTRRTSSWVPPPAGTRPRRTSGSPKVASVAATTRSQARASSVPPPRAKPRTAATVGSGQRRTAANPRRNASRCTNQPWSSKPARCLRSAPTQKARSPAPVSTTARTPGSVASGSTASASATASSVEIAFSASGRSRVTVATRPSTSTRTSGLTGRSSPADAAGVDRLERPGPGAGQPVGQVGLGCPAEDPPGLAAVQGDAGQLARPGRGELRLGPEPGDPPQGVVQLQHRGLDPGADVDPGPGRVRVLAPGHERVDHVLPEHVVAGLSAVAEDRHRLVGPPPGAEDGHHPGLAVGVLPGPVDVAQPQADRLQPVQLVEAGQVVLGRALGHPVGVGDPRRVALVDRQGRRGGLAGHPPPRAGEDQPPAAGLPGRPGQGDGFGHGDPGVLQRVADAAADVDLGGQVVDDLGPRPPRGGPPPPSR